MCIFEIVPPSLAALTARSGRRKLTHASNPSAADSHRASSVEMVTIDPLDLKEAQDRECNRSPETTREKTD
jgi:hypothetical protein